MSDVLNSANAAPSDVLVNDKATAGAAAQDRSAPHSGLSHMQRWLSWQCRKIPGVIRAAVYAVSPASGQVDDATRGASWPDAVEDPAALLTLANAALLRKSSVAKSIATSGENARQIDCISVPLPAENPRYVFVLLVGNSAIEQRQALSELIMWGSDWLLEPEAERPAEPQWTEPGQWLSKCLGASDLRHLSQEFVSQVAQNFKADRVSLGLVKRRKVSLKVISGLAFFDARMHAASSLRIAMQEALDLDQSVSLEAGAGSLVYPGHQALIGERRCTVDTVLLKDGMGVIGALTVERREAEGPTPALAAEHVGELAQLTTSFTPLLRLHRDAERGVLQRIASGTAACCWQLIALREQDSLGKTMRVAVSLLAVVGLLAMLVLPGEYRITSGATIEGSGRQVLVAPFEGFIRSANARAGDTVEEGAIIAELDTGALELQQGKWHSELDKLEKSYSQALATGDRTELSLLNALREELQAELALVEQRLQRSVIRAPYPGVLVSGDLHQLLGAPVEAGQPLFEISSLDKFRLMLDIDEQVVASIETGQAGTVRLASMPGVKYNIQLKHLQPVATVVEGKNVFRMEAELLNPDASIRPGMTGVAKIRAGERSRVWLWSHSLLDRLRIWSWSLGFGQ